MRDWLYELTQHLYIHEIAEKTGISQKRLRDFYTGRAELHSRLPEYEKLRNLNRRLAYQKLRQAGATPEQARRHRRTFFDPFREEKETKSLRLVNPEKFPEGEDRYQLRILGVYRHRESGERKIAEGFSWARKEKDEERQEGEALRHGQNRLGSTRWEIETVLEKEWITFRGGEGWEQYKNNKRKRG